LLTSEDVTLNTKYRQSIEGLEFTILFGRLISWILDKLAHQREGETIGGDEFRFQDGVVVKGLSVVSASETIRAVTSAKADRAGSIDGHDEIDPQQTVTVENLLANEGFGHSTDDRLHLEGRFQGIAMRKRLHSKEGLEFTDRGTVAEQQPDLSSRFELK
jgi:hypothetical protein